MAFISERDISYIYSPLSTSQGVDVKGNVTSSQVYDPASGTFSPDYTLTFLVLQPWFAIVDPDGVLQSGRVEIANPVWYEISNGVKTAITSSSTQYAVVPSGANAGQLTVKRNCAPDTPLALLFTGEYVDTRTGGVYQIVIPYIVVCESSDYKLETGVNLPRMIRYDPIRDTSHTRTVTPWMKAEGKDVPAANRKFVWMKKDKGDTAFATVGSSILDYDVDVAADGSSATVDLDLIGHRIDLRVYFFYNPYGAVTDTTITPETRYADVTFLRTRTKLTPVPKSYRRVAKGQTTLFAEVDVQDAKGIIPDPDKYLDIEWKMSQGKADGAVSYGQTLAKGSSVELPLSGTSAQYGGTTGVFVNLRKPLSAFRDPADDAIIVDDDGKVIIG